MTTRRLAWLGVMVIMLSFNLPAENQESVPLNERELLERARAIHQRILTLDTHCDTAMRLVRGTGIRLNGMTLILLVAVKSICPE